MRGEATPGSGRGRVLRSHWRSRSLPAAPWRPLGRRGVVVQAYDRAGERVHPRAHRPCPGPRGYGSHSDRGGLLNGLNAERTLQHSQCAVGQCRPPLSGLTYSASSFMLSPSQTAPPGAGPSWWGRYGAGRQDWRQRSRPSTAGDGTVGASLIQARAAVATRRVRRWMHHALIS